jgi:hypothetical protein
MSLTGRGTLLVLSVGVAVVVAAIPGAACAKSTKKLCVDDNAEAQDLRRSGRFAEAIEHLNRCAARACPAIVRDDCTSRLNDLNLVQPSLVFEVRNPFGMDLVSIRVSMDDQLLTERLDGTPLKVDPGSHVFTFEAPNQPIVTGRILIREGEVARHERVVIGHLLSSAEGASPALNAPIAQESRGPARSQRQVLGLSAAGVGVASVVLGTVFGLMARSAWTEAKKACGGDASHCSNISDANTNRSEALTDATVSTAAFIAGGVLIAGGAVLYVTGRPQEKMSEGLALAADIKSGSLGAMLRGSF